MPGTNALKLFDAVVSNKASSGRTVTMKLGTSTLDISDATKANTSRGKLKSTYKYDITSTRDANGYINAITFTQK